MPECKTCEGAGSVIKTKEGKLVPFYKAFRDKIEGEKLLCTTCDGGGRTVEESS